jgi:superoxide dismutase
VEVLGWQSNIENVFAGAGNGFLTSDNKETLFIIQTGMAGTPVVSTIVKSVP